MYVIFGYIHPSYRTVGRIKPRTCFYKKIVFNFLVSISVWGGREGGGGGSEYLYLTFSQYFPQEGGGEEERGIIRQKFPPFYLGK